MNSTTALAHPDSNSVGYYSGSESDLFCNRVGYPTIDRTRPFHRRASVSEDEIMKISEQLVAGNGDDAAHEPSRTETA